MKVKEVMSKDVKSCAANDTMDCAARIMWEQDCGCVPIVDADSRVIGMITDRDICMAAYTQARRVADIPISSAMSREPCTCGPDDTIERSEQLMRDHQIHRLPVVDQRGQLIGILSLTDLARHAARGDAVSPVEATLAAVCRARFAESTMPA